MKSAHIITPMLVQCPLTAAQSMRTRSTLLHVTWAAHLLLSFCGPRNASSMNSPACLTMAHLNCVPQVMKVFLIVAPPEEDGMLQLDQVWALDAETRSLSRQEVVRETTVEDPMQLTLRIRHALVAAHHMQLGRYFWVH